MQITFDNTFVKISKEELSVEQSDGYSCSKFRFGQTISCILEIYSDVISAVIENLLISQCLRDKKLRSILFYR